MQSVETYWCSVSEEARTEEGRWAPTADGDRSSRRALTKSRIAGYEHWESGQAGLTNLGTIFVLKVVKNQLCYRMSGQVCQQSCRIWFSR